MPAPPANAGFVTGITQSAAGDLYVAAASLDPASYAPGIYKIPAAGGPVTTAFAADAAMTLPNGLVFDKEGNLFVTGRRASRSRRWARRSTPSSPTSGSSRCCR